MLALFIGVTEMTPFVLCTSARPVPVKIPGGVLIGVLQLTIEVHGKEVVVLISVPRNSDGHFSYKVRKEHIPHAGNVFGLLIATNKKISEELIDATFDKYMKILRLPDSRSSLSGSREIFLSLLANEAFRAVPGLSLEKGINHVVETLTQFIEDGLRGHVVEHRHADTLHRTVRARVAGFGKQFVAKLLPPNPHRKAK